MSGNSSPTIQSDAERAKSLKAKLTSLFPDSLPHIDRCLDSVRKNKKLSLKEPMGLIFLFFFFFFSNKNKIFSFLLFQCQRQRQVARIIAVVVCCLVAMCQCVFISNQMSLPHIHTIRLPFLQPLSFVML
jgi:hypothetical protein